MAGTVRTSSIGSPSPSNLSGTGLVFVEALAWVSSRGISKPRCDASELDSSLRPKGGKKPAPRAGETSGTKPQARWALFSIGFSRGHILREVLFAPEVARGMFRSFLKGTSSGVSLALAEGLFLVTGLGDGGASLLFFGSSSFGDRLLVPRNVISKKLPQISLGHKVVKINSLNFSALTLAADQSL
jgi:hypothetical protein